MTAAMQWRSRSSGWHSPSQAWKTGEWGPWTDVRDGATVTLPGTTRLQFRAKPPAAVPPPSGRDTSTTEENQVENAACEHENPPARPAAGQAPVMVGGGAS